MFDRVLNTPPHIWCGQGKADFVPNKWSCTSDDILKHFAFVKDWNFLYIQKSHFFRSSMAAIDKLFNDAESKEKKDILETRRQKLKDLLLKENKIYQV